MRIGIGYDIHRTAKGRKLMLGGVLIPSDMGSLGHSDADVLIHAICDAILGALGKPDIGEYFPDTDPKYKGISSAILLKKVGRIARKNEYAVNNLDSTIILEKPRLSPFKNRIRETIAEILNISPTVVNVKAKTNEGLGDIGKNKAIAAYAVVSLKKL
jgi:2-C-methyl-D-erythritol 2,4-cyclodiphosphate synthase